MPSPQPHHAPPLRLRRLHALLHVRLLPAAPTVSGLDKALAISAMVAALFAVGTVIYLWKGISIDY